MSIWRQANHESDNFLTLGRATIITGLSLGKIREIVGI